jgi:hypothetical protein
LPISALASIGKGNGDPSRIGVALDAGGGPRRAIPPESACWSRSVAYDVAVVSLRVRTGGWRDGSTAPAPARSLEKGGCKVIRREGQR